MALLRLDDDAQREVRDLVRSMFVSMTHDDTRDLMVATDLVELLEEDDIAKLGAVIVLIMRMGYGAIVFGCDKIIEKSPGLDPIETQIQVIDRMLEGLLG